MQVYQLVNLSGIPDIASLISKGENANGSHLNPPSSGGGSSGSSGSGGNPWGHGSPHGGSSGGTGNSHGHHGGTFNIQ